MVAELQRRDLARGLGYACARTGLGKHRCEPGRPRARGDRSGGVRVSSVRLVVGHGRHDAIAQRGRRGEDAVVVDGLVVRPRGQCAEPLDERVWLEEHVRAAIAEAAVELVQDLAVVGAAEAVEDDRWAGRIAAELVDPLGQAGGAAHSGVQREAVETATELALDERLVAGAAAEPLVLGARALTGGGAALDCGGSSLAMGSWESVMWRGKLPSENRRITADQRL